jgi:hypothetical protein
MISAVPACSAEEAQKGIGTELLVTKTLPELVNVMNINNSQKKELNELTNNPNLLYGHTVQKLGCNLTLANYVKLTEFLQNTSNSEADWTFYNQWINDTQQVVTYKSMTDTVENIYMSNPLLQATIQGFEDSYVKYNQMSEYDQWRFIQTKSITDDDLEDAYANATPGQLSFMLDQSLPELQDTINLGGQSTSYLIDHISEVADTTQRGVKSFNDKTMWAYEFYNKNNDNDNSTPNDDALETLLNARKTLNDQIPTWKGCSIGFGAASAALFILGWILLECAPFGTGFFGIGALVLATLLGACFIVFISLYENYIDDVGELTNRIHALYPDYDDSKFHPNK